MTWKAKMWVEVVRGLLYKQKVSMWKVRIEERIKEVSTWNVGYYIDCDSLSLASASLCRKLPYGTIQPPTF